MSFAPFEPLFDPNPIRTAAAVQSGPPVTPLQRIYLYDDGAWEEFTREWASFRKNGYLKVEKYAGAGDKGVDVAGFSDSGELLGAWDCYQCKHYANPLNRSDGVKEIAKILYFSHRGDYLAPRAYRFVAPRGLSTQFSQLLSNAELLRTAIFDDWSKVVSVLPPGTSAIMADDMIEYVNAYDFETFGSVPVPTLIEEHSQTPYHIHRFGGGLGDRPPVSGVPEAVGGNELRYTQQLLEAYGDKTGAAINVSGLSKHGKLKDHFHRARESFFEAEALRLFVRDKVVPGTFEDLQNEVHDAVVDMHDGNHDNGYERMQTVTAAAQSLNLSAHALGGSVLPRDQRGICHQLANDDRLTWVQK